MKKNKTSKPKQSRRNPGRGPRKTLAVSMPAAVGYKPRPSQYEMRNIGPGHVRVSGHEYLGNLGIGSSAITQNLAGVFDLNPACWTDSRLSLIARAYEKYRFESVTLHYIPAVGTTTAGSIAIGVEPDPTEVLPANANFYARTLNMQFSSMGPVWSAQSTTYRRNVQDHAWYFASLLGETSKRENVQAVAFAVTNAPQTGSGQLLGHFMVEYVVDFIYPELEQLDGGEQFSEAVTVGNNAVAASTPLVSQISGALGADIVESRLVTDIPDLLKEGASLILRAGQSLFWAFDGTNWRAYADLGSALVKNAPLVTTVARAIGFLNGRTFNRRLIAATNQA